MTNPARLPAKIYERASGRCTMVNRPGHNGELFEQQGTFPPSPTRCTDLVNCKVGDDSRWSFITERLCEPFKIANIRNASRIHSIADHRSRKLIRRRLLDLMCMYPESIRQGVAIYQEPSVFPTHPRGRRTAPPLFTGTCPHNLHRPRSPYTPNSR
jgi:hypothetical protein